MKRSTTTTFVVWGGLLLAGGASLAREPVWSGWPFVLFPLVCLALGAGSATIGLADWWSAAKAARDPKIRT